MGLHSSLNQEQSVLCIRGYGYTIPGTSAALEVIVSAVILGDQVNRRGWGWRCRVLRNLRRTGCTRAVAAGSAPCRRPLQRPAKGHRGTKICRAQSVDMPLELFLELVRRLLRILAQAGLVD